MLRAAIANIRPRASRKEPSYYATGGWGVSCVSNFTKFLLQLLQTQSSALGRRDIIFSYSCVSPITAQLQSKVKISPKMLQIPHNCPSLPVSKYCNRKYCSSEIKFSLMLRVHIVTSDWVSLPGGTKKSLSSISYRPSLCPSHLPVQCVPEVSLRKYSSRSLRPTYHLHLTPRFTRIHYVVLNHSEGDLYLYHEQYTVEYARTNVIGSRTSFVIASVRSSTH